MARAINLSRPTAQYKWLFKLLRQFIFYVFVLLIWEGISRSGIWPDYLFVGPTAVAHSLIVGFQKGTMITAILVSMRRLFLGYVISVVIGVILGLLIGSNRYIEETLGSLVLGLQALPSVCWIPLALLWFGLSEQAMLFVVVMGALFSVTLSVDAGIKNTPPVYVKAARNMGARGLALNTQVILPAALPSILTGLKQGWTFAWRSLMAAELLYITPSLGGLLDNGRNFGDIALIFAVIIIIIVIGLTIDNVIFNPLERLIRTRWGFAGAH
ncbi:ABC transporter permease [Tengunoibacter tsumagoiensis]|uniref:Sulfate ABC transporter permease n=1 Tax=Tengunoibacter tsumagoiensis TaxID=2014871 RepID=A0A402A1H3_9CHLR|nr:ABC transporter permease [Tengunoibacter tsumagoiensis]GCE12998.1 sulfate ABC transporter permease [Tengunoibacter tsumagoiensis]